MTDFQTYELTIGDGHSHSKDGRAIITVSWTFTDMDTWLKRLVAARFPDYEHEIENAWTDDTEDGNGVWMCVDAGPLGELDGFGGPWLIAELKRVETAREEEKQAA